MMRRILAVLLLLMLGAITSHTTATPDHQPYQPSGPIRDVEWHPSGEYFAFGGGGGVWVYTDTMTYVAFIPFENFSVLAWSPDGQYLAVAGADSRAATGWLLKIWDFSQQQERLILTKANENSDAHFLAWHPTGTQLAFGLRSRVDIIDVQSGQVLHTLDNGTSIAGLAWNPSDPAQLVTGGLSDLLVWNLDTLSATVFSTDSRTIDSIVWNPSGTLLAFADHYAYDLVHVIRIWDIASGSEVTTFEGEWGSIADLAWNANNQLASLSDKIRVWDMATYQEIQVIDYDGVLRAFDWSPDNITLICAVDNSLPKRISVFDSLNMEDTP